MHWIQVPPSSHQVSASERSPSHTFFLVTTENVRVTGLSEPGFQRLLPHDMKGEIYPNGESSCPSRAFVEPSRLVLPRTLRLLEQSPFTLLHTERVLDTIIQRRSRALDLQSVTTSRGTHLPRITPAPSSNGNQCLPPCNTSTYWCSR